MQKESLDQRGPSPHAAAACRRSKIVLWSMRRLAVAVCIVTSCLLMSLPRAHGQSGGEKLPAFEVVKKVVVAHFTSLPDFEAADLITRKDVAPLFARLQKIGWDVADKKSLLARVPGEDDFLVKQLSTSSGRRFMRSISQYPDAYDRLERLSRLKQGEQTVKDLVRGPDGYKLIKYLTTESGGAQLGKMLSDAPGGKKFNQTTNRIYTATQLLAALKASHDHARAGKP